jgi:tripartite-type tricarboxylate transporter receptor subunit TctC
VRGLFLAAALCAALTGPAAAQQEAHGWPGKPVRLVVPFTLGGATDIVARILAPSLAEVLGQPFIVENRPGAGGNIGVEYVVHAPADGLAVLVGNISTNAINPTGFAKSLKFSAVKDLTGVTLIASVPTVLVAGAQLPPNNVKELIEYARARPGELNYSNPIGAYSHLDTLDLSARTGIKVVHVPSKGAGTAVTPLLSGEIHFSFLTMSAVIPYIRSGKLKAYATTAPRRLPELPDVPTMAEAGFPGVGSVNWNGFFVHAKTPRPIVNKLYAATMQVMQRAQVKEAFANSFVPVTLSKSPEEFQQYVEAEAVRWARIVREHNVRME